VRRAKLYFIRDKVAREVRRQLRNMRMVNMSTDDFAEDEIVEAPADETAIDVEETPAGEVAETVAPEVAVEEELVTKDPEVSGELVEESAEAETSTEASEETPA
jgi:hypothetical protein